MNRFERDIPHKLTVTPLLQGGLLDDIDQRKSQKANILETGINGALDLVWKHSPDSQNRKEIVHYAAGMAKTAALFIPGPYGVAATVGVNILDSVKYDDSLSNQVIDGGLGATKGLALRGLFAGANYFKFSPVTKGVGLGMSMRALEIGLNRDSYTNKDGQFDFSYGMGKLKAGTLNRDAINSDILVFGGSHLIQHTLFGNMAARPLAATLLTGGVFGVTAGAIGEINRQRSLHQPIDHMEVAKRALLQGTLDTIAAIPGGLMNRAAYRHELALRAQAENRKLSERPVAASDEIVLRPPARRSELLHDAPDLGTPEVPRLAEILPRLSYETGTYKFQEAKPGAQPNWNGAGEYADSATHWVERPARFYTVEGLSTKIVVSEAYARELDAVRNFRLRAEGVPVAPGEAPNLGLLDRALPEDFVPFLERLPNSKLVQHLVIARDPNPLDPWFAREANQADFASAAVARDHSITFFGRTTGKGILLEMNHEWGHLLGTASPLETHLYKLAATVEQNGYQARDRGALDVHENWAVALGENLLSPYGPTFAQQAVEAPVRSIVLAQALRRTGVSDPALLARLDLIENRVMPLAVKSLVESANNSGTAQSEAAIRLLVNLHQGHRLAEVAGPLHLKLGGEPIGDAHAAKLRELRNVASFEAPDTYLTNFRFAADWSTLRTLNLSGVRTRGFEPLENMPELVDLRLARTPLDNGDIGYLSGLSSLRKLDISGTKFTKLADLRAALPDCQITKR